TRGELKVGGSGVNRVIDANQRAGKGRRGRQDEEACQSCPPHVPSAWVNSVMAGYSSTPKSEGKIRNTSGKRILIGAFCARSSACARRRLRISTARFRMIVSMDTPSVSPCRTERKNDRIEGVSQSQSRYVSE